MNKKGPVIIKRAHFVSTMTLKASKCRKDKNEKIISVEELVLSESDDQDDHVKDS